MNKITTKILLAALGIMALVASVIFYLSFTPSNQEIKIQTNENIVEERVGIPLHISIPKISVEADIEQAGLAKDGTIAVPDGPNGVTWYKDGARPGEKGSAVITGHYGPWRSGEGSIFDNLNKLEKGDKIYIKNDKGNTLTFEVQDKKTYKLSETVPEVFIKDNASYLNLITCSGQWLADQKTFTNRLVVFTSLVD